MNEETFLDYKKGDSLFREGDSSKDLFIIQTGAVKIYKTTDGKDFPIAIVQAGQFIGELAFFDGKARSATATALTDVRVIKMNQVKLEQELNKLPSWLLVMIKSLADRIRQTDEIIKRNSITDKKMSEEFSSWEKK